MNGVSVPVNAAGEALFTAADWRVQVEGIAVSEGGLEGADRTTFSAHAAGATDNSPPRCRHRARR
ncbi:MAG: hypothetical protein R3F14_23055 [Polyangiaceae bacterium]